MRGHASPISASNMGNDVDDSTVDALLGACRRGSSEFRAYFGLKAKMLGARRLSRYDLYAPAPRAASAGRRYPYDEAVRAVLGALGGFSTELGEHARRVVDSGHIDSEVRAGKRDGAFCSSPAPRVTPYILLSYRGALGRVHAGPRDGPRRAQHGSGGRSALVHDAQLPLAETASTFAELLLYDSLAGGAGGPGKTRRARRSGRGGLGAGAGDAAQPAVEHLDGLYATVVRQSFFTIFEQAAHDMVGGRGGGGGAAAEPATADSLSRAYMDGLSEQFGRSVEVPHAFADEWVSIPHFFHSPVLLLLVRVRQPARACPVPEAQKGGPVVRAHVRADTVGRGIAKARRAARRARL